MAILLIKIEDLSTLPMNEFFDYDGWCYGLTRSRTQSGDQCMDLEDFYECTVRSERIAGVPVIFMEERKGSFFAAGWYREAEIYRKIRRLSLFLEGNVKADARRVILLPDKERTCSFECYFGKRLYEVVETSDSRYESLVKLMDSHDGSNVFLRYALADVTVEPRLKRDYDACIEQCERLAQRLMADECRDIREIKTLEICGEQAAVLNSRSADGYYYEAMACDQLGRVKKGMKAIEKALKLEPDAPDLLAMKANLLVGLGHADAAAELFHKAWQTEGDEDYLMLEGRTWLFKGQMDKALACFKKITNRQALDDAGINLKDMERKWPFMNVRGFHLKKLFGK